MALMAVLCFLFGANTQAQLQWRLSVKLILDAGGNPPTSGNGIGSAAEIQNHVNAANAFLDRAGRGYQLNLTEVVNLPGVSQWYSVNARDSGNKANLEAAAMGNPGLYAWRSDSINIYINNTSSGVCSFPNSGNAIFQGQSQPGGTNGYPAPFHEMGHFFNLCHTMGCDCGDCGDGTSGCDMGTHDDGLADTIRDSTCWNRDQVSINNFGAPYASLNAGQQNAVNYTYQNVMSYHTDSALNSYLETSDQLDRITDASNGPRNFVCTGHTQFVDHNGCPFPNGSSGCSIFGGPYHSVGDGINNANGGDIVLIRPGHYNEPMTISKPVTLRATRGDATIGAP